MKITKRRKGVGENLLTPLTVTNTGMEMVHNTAHPQFDLAQHCKCMHGRLLMGQLTFCQQLGR